MPTKKEIALETVAAEVDHVRKFEEEAEKRVAAILNQIDLLKKLARTRRKHYTTQHSEKIIGAIDEALGDCEKVFAGETESKPVFKF